jgi:hypothetical protein
MRDVRYPLERLLPLPPRELEELSGWMLPLRGVLSVSWRGSSASIAVREVRLASDYDSDMRSPGRKNMTHALPTHLKERVDVTNHHQLR